MKRGIFRWKAIGALAAVLLVLGGLWVIFGDRIVKSELESTGSSILGAELDVGSLTIHTSTASVEMAGLQIASPFDSTKNLVESKTMVIDLAFLPLLQKKLVVDRMVLGDLRFMTTRAKPARSYATKNGIAARLVNEMTAWAKKVDVPLLSLTPIDTIRSLVLDPSSLATIKAVNALTARADSVKGAFQKSIADLHLQQVIDSTQALAKQLAATKTSGMGIADIAQNVAAARKGIDRVNETKKQIESLEQSAKTAATLLAGGIHSVDSARQSDYEFAKGLLKLPKLEAPNIGPAMFGPVSIGRLQQAIYWARLAQEYIPPGLQFWRRPGPSRARMAGTTYSFPLVHTDPDLLLREGTFSFALATGPVTGSFSGTVTGLTTQPAIYGRPATLKASGTTTGKDALTADVGAVMDHTGSPVRDSARARLEGVPIPSFELPGLPFGVAPGHGESELTMAIRGDQVDGSWSMRSTEAAWHVAPASAQSLNLMESTVYRVLSGLTELDVTAEVHGNLASPSLSVSSNVDKEIAARLRAILGEELVKAEAKAKAAVDKIVADKVEPITKQVAGVQGLIDSQLGGAKGQLDQVEKQLEAEIARATGAGNLFNLPKIKP
jgi:uncharacterized protein (TIGR03545 family)